MIGLNKPKALNNIMSIVLLFILFQLSACSSVGSHEKVTSIHKKDGVTSGFGGTGNRDSGFGGTGYGPSGFGGTGIVGTVTKFGSIWVNGIEVDYGKDTHISSDLTAKESLKLGQQVVLETAVKDGKVVTQKIVIYYPIAGKITAVSNGQITLENKYKVNIQTARKDKGLEIKVGEFVAINGYSDETGGWIATRVNKNLEHKIFYHPVPKLAFSSSVKQVLIETSAHQLKQWRALKGSIQHLSRQHQRIMLMGKFKNNRIHIDRIKPYSVMPKALRQNMNMKKHGKNFGKRGFEHSRHMLQGHRQHQQNHQGR